MINSLRGFVTIAVCSLFTVGVQAQVPDEDSAAKYLLPETMLLITQSSQGQSQTSIMWIGAGHYRLQSLQNGQQGVEIFRDDTVYLLNFGERTYTSLNHERVVAAAEQTRKLLPNAARPTVQRELRETQRLVMFQSKWPCQFWEVLEDGVLTKEMCVVPLKLLPNRNSVRETIERYNAVFKDTDTNDASLPWSDFETTEGLPLLVRNFVDGKLHAETTVTSLQPNQPPLPKRYELPPGMTEITGNEQ